MKENVAEQLINKLEKEGVKHLYSVTGDSLNYVNRAVRKNGKIKWIHVRHEETGAYAAGAEAQLTGKLTCCAGSSGPGHVHLINGLYDAHRSHAPVLAIASTEPVHEFGTQYFQETDPNTLFADCSYYRQMVTNPVQMPRMLQSAMQTAVSRKGVVVLGLPGDLAHKEAVPYAASPLFYPDAAIAYPPQYELDSLAARLNKSNKIVLFCGSGSKNAHDEIATLANRLHAPVVSTFKSKMDILYDMPNAVGMTGLLGVPSAYAAMHQAEVLLLLGVDFPYEKFLPQQAWAAQIDNCAERLGRRMHIQMGLHGDVKATLQALLPLLKPKEDTSFLDEQLAHHHKVKRNLKKIAAHVGRDHNLSPESVISYIDRYASESAVFTVDTGMCCVWAARYLTPTRDRTMLGSFNHGSMANALPQAIGAALACPTRQIIAICGDGGLSMLLGDLATVSQYKLPIKIFVFNNRSLGMVKLEMEVEGIPDWQTDMKDIDFELIAEAMGIPAITIKSPQDLEEGIQYACNQNEAILVNIYTDPNALVIPSKLESNEMVGFAKSMYKMLISGDIKEIKDTIETNYYLIGV